MESAEQSKPRVYVRVEESHHSIYEALTRSRDDEELCPFEGMANLFMLAAFIGYHEEKWIPVEKSQNIFAWTVLKNDITQFSLLRALALAKTGNIEVLTDERAIQDVAEGYANGGIAVIREQVEDVPGDSRVQNLVELLLNWDPYKGMIASSQ